MNCSPFLNRPPLDIVCGSEMNGARSRACEAETARAPEVTPKRPAKPAPDNEASTRADVCCFSPNRMETAQEIAEQTFRCGKTCLSLESLELQELPPEIFKGGFHLSTVTLLKLDYNDLTSLPDEISGLTCLKELSVIGNQLETLPDSIEHLTNLEEVYLNENSLTSLPSTFAKLKRLRILNLVGNGLQKWNEEFDAAFGESLTQLHLDENNLPSLPQSFGLLRKLQVLELGDNALQSLPETFGELQGLEILNLGQNKLTALPKSFGDLPNLVALDLTENKLENLPETFKSSNSIQHLFLDKNGVKSLPAWFGELQNITDISLSDNLLHQAPLPSCFGNVSGASLKVLDLSGNSITVLPDSLGELKTLEDLHLGSTINELERRAFQNGNWLHKLPENFGGMKNLRKLHLDENQLCELPVSFGSLENLEWVDLAQNLLVELPESFCHLTKLWYLQLSKNHLKALPEDFGKLTSLTDLRLDNNYLTDLPDSFTNLKGLQTLDLFRNKLCKIPKVLLQLKKLIRLDLDGNSLKIKSDKVPKLTAQVKYPARDPKLKDDWRGKTREDYVPPSDVSTVEILDEVEEDGDDDAEDIEEESTFNESALVRAMRRGLSIWKSHNGPANREQENAGAFSQEQVSTTYATMYQPPVPSGDESLYTEATHQIFEDADEINPDLRGSIVTANGVERDINLVGLEGSEEATEAEPQNEPLGEEDWDKEIQETRAYEYVLRRFKDPGQVQGEFTNKLQNFLLNYPPAVQAFSQTAVYKSVVYSMPFQQMQQCSGAFISMADGQFEDAVLDGEEQSVVI